MYVNNIEGKKKYKMSDMKEKMYTGELYLPGDDEIMKEQMKRPERLYEYNMTRPSKAEKRAELLRSMFAEIGGECYAYLCR